MEFLPRRALVLGFLLAVPTAAVVVTACSGGGGNGSTSNGGSTNTGGSTTGTGTGVTSCSTPTGLQITFAPMYSAYEPTHKYQLPAVVTGVDQSLVTWSASAPNMVSFEADSATGGTLMTMLNSGTVTIFASAGGATGLCGSAELNITAATADDWNIGNARYNDGTAFHLGGKDGGTVAVDGGGPACTNCHGPLSDGGPFNDVAHTPEQTGGFSDSDMINIVTAGEVPDGGYFDPTIITYAHWQKLHQWSDITGDEQKGIVVYLRSLTPSSQNGTSNFGGHFDGGFPHDGGGFPHDAGGGG